jgi:hypothetical protein
LLDPDNNLLTFGKDIWILFYTYSL